MLQSFSMVSNSQDETVASEEFPVFESKNVDSLPPQTPGKGSTCHIKNDGAGPLGIAPVNTSSPLPSVRSLPSDPNMNSNGPDTPSVSPENFDDGKLTIAAIPILFKEAMLDTPTFRAHCEHMHRQFLEIDDWVQGLVTRNNGIDSSLKRLRHSVNNVTEMFMPLFIYDNALDQSNLSVVFEKYAEGVSLHWTSVMYEARKHISHITNSYRIFHQNQIAHYDAARSKLLQQQKLFDKATAEYYALSKKTEPSTLRDAAQQVYKFRLRYLKQSLLFCEVLGGHQKKLNDFIVDALARPLQPDVPTLIPAPKRAEIGNIMLRAAAYTKSQYAGTPTSTTAIKQIRSDLLQDGKKRSPSKSTTDYGTAPSIWFDQPSMFNSKNTIKEKYGWVMLKLPQGSRNSKAQWVRIWLFVKGGSIGWLSLSESKAFVQQSPIIAAPLCDIKNAANEDRNFCFTVTTAQVSFVLQAGNRAELQNWISVVQFARKEYLGLGRTKLADELWANDITCRYANKVLEVNGVPPPRASDNEAAQTVSKRVDACVDSISNGFNISSRTDLGGSDIYSRLTPSLLQQKPLATTRSLEACVASSLFPLSTVPNAIIGNYGGSVNWSLYTDALPKIAPEKLAPENKSRPKHEQYPSFYPKNLQFHDIDMRSYFGSRFPHDHDEDLAVMVVRASIRLKGSYYLPLTIYATGNNIYFINSSSGFTGLLDIPIQSLLVVQCEVGTDHDMVKITYNIDRDFKEVELRFYIDSGKLFQRRLQFLLDNSKLAQSLKLEGIIDALQDIGRKHQDDFGGIPESPPAPSPLKNAQIPALPHEDSEHASIFDLEANNTILHANTHPREHHGKAMKLVQDVHLQISPCQLFRLIFGDKSSVFGDVVTNKDDLEWFYSDSKIQRVFAIDTVKLLLFSGDAEADEGIDVTQTLERRDENYFYSVDENMEECSLYSVSFKLRTKYVIALTRQSTRLMIYVGLLWPQQRVGNTQVVLDKIFQETCEKRPIMIVDKIKREVSALQRVSPDPHHYDLSRYGQVRITAARTEKQISARKQHHVSSGKLLRLMLQSLSSVMWWKFWKTVRQAFWKVIQECSVHMWLLLGLVVSVTLNAYFISSSGLNMWKDYFMVRSTERYVNALNLSPEALVGHKAIYSKDVEQIVQHGRDFSEIADDNNTCWQSFKRIVLDNPRNHPDQLGHAGLDTESQTLIDNMLRKRYELGLKRSELLSELWKLEHNELELVRLEWKRWVLNEVKNCAEARQYVAVTDKTGIELALIEYCVPCIDAANLLL